jgi:hypothetical protein
LFLEDLSGWKKALPIFLVLLELCPGQQPPVITVSSKLFEGPSPFAREILQLVGSSPLLVAPVVQSEFQLSSVTLPSPLLSGYSGRYPENSFMLAQLLGKGRIRLAADFSEARWIASTDDAVSAKLQSDSDFSSHGCFEHYQFRACLFERVTAKRIDTPSRLRLDQDVSWEYPHQAKGHLAVLRATRDGMLDYANLGTCKLASYLKFGFLPEIPVVNTLTGVALRGVEFKTGEVILEEKSRQGIFSLPLAIRPSKRYEILCSHQG